MTRENDVDYFLLFIIDCLFLRLVLIVKCVVLYNFVKLFTCSSSSSRSLFIHGTKFVSLKNT